MELNSNLKLKLVVNRGSGHRENTANRGSYGATKTEEIKEEKGMKETG